MALAVAEFQGALAQLAQQLGVSVDRLLANLDRLSAPEQFAFLTYAYPELVSPYLAASGDLTAQWYSEQPGGASGFVPQPADLPPTNQLAVNARWALTQTAVDVALRGAATRAVFDQSRRTVVENADREGVRWARHASATACGFCRMLATRGAVYHSEALALKAHDHCHCIAVPDRDGKYEPATYVAQWEKDYRAARADGARSPGDIAAAMDKAAADRAPATASGVSVPPTKKPPRPKLGGAAGDPADDDKAAWKARQDALPVDFKGETLDAHEVRFVERFLDAGETMEWIPRDRPKDGRSSRKSTNDFFWLSNGRLPTEVKNSSTARYDSIHGTIVKAASRAAKHNVVKENFIIDLGDIALTDELRSDLAAFNVGRRKYRLKGLWVMSRGVLHRIDLET